MYDVRVVRCLSLHGRPCNAFTRRGFPLWGRGWRRQSLARRRPSEPRRQTVGGVGGAMRFLGPWAQLESNPNAKKTEKTLFRVCPSPMLVAWNCV